MTAAAIHVNVAHYAGFWRRFLALIIDTMILSAAYAAIFAAFQALKLPPLYVIEGTIDFASFHGQNWQISYNLTPFGSALVLAAGWLYCAGMESSPQQATIGKMALSIRVGDMTGERVSFWRATARHFAKILSCVTLLIGFVMAAFTRRKQALHDIVTGCTLRVGYA